MNKLYIQKNIRIKNQEIVENNEVIFKDEESEDFASFIKNSYKHFELNYPKFYKMDSLCKLGFVASDILLQNIDRSEIKPEEICIVLVNKSSSLNTDAAYQESISDIPSPAVFVYTLPNIIIGEICIRNDIKGESLFFIEDNFNPNLLTSYLNSVFSTTNTKICITGWVEMDMENNYYADLYLVTPNQTETEFSEINLKNNHTYGTIN